MDLHNHGHPDDPSPWVLCLGLLPHLAEASLGLDLQDCVLRFGYSQIPLHFLTGDESRLELVSNEIWALPCHGHSVLCSSADL